MERLKPEGPDTPERVVHGGVNGPSAEDRALEMVRSPLCMGSVEYAP